MELLPCPFCGNEAERKHDERGNKWVECVYCGASSWRSDHITYAINWWNTRAEQKDNK